MLSRNIYVQVDDTNELSNLVLYEVKKGVKKGMSMDSVNYCDLSNLVNFTKFTCSLCVDGNERGS